MSGSHPGQFTISKVASKGINHQRFSYDAASGYTLKTTKGTGKAKKASTITARCTLEEFVRKSLAKELGLALPCPGSPFAILCGNAPVRDGSSAADGYVVCEDSDED